MQSISTAERRRRLQHRHLLNRAASPVEVAGALVGLHSSDPATVYLSLAARTEASAEAVAQALYEDKSLIRLLVMRRTIFAMPLELAPVAFAACAGTNAARGRRRLLRCLEAAGHPPDLEAWLSDLEQEIVDLLRQRPMAGAELSAQVEGLRRTINPAPGKGPEMRITTWTLDGLSMAGRIARGRPGGGLTSSRYTWTPIEAWYPEGIPAMAPEAARAELVRRWLASYGPGTLLDVHWWTGLNKGQCKTALAAVEAVEVQLEEGVGYVLPDDLEDTPPSEACARLLPGLDPTPMGWKARGWYLGEHQAALFDRNGNVGPTVWWGGRVVGGWTQRPSGEIVYRLLEEAPVEAVDAEVERTQAWLGDAVVTPRFRTPLERALRD